MKRSLLVLAVAALVVWMGCSKKVEPPKEIQFFNCDTLDGVLTEGVAVVDTQNPAEGTGSLKIASAQPVTLPLFEIKLPGDGAKFTLQYKMKVKDYSGDAYGQMDFNYGSGGKQSPNNYPSAMGGTSDWQQREISYTVQRGQKVSSIVFSLILNGSGTVWVDDVHLIRAPLPE